MATFSTFSLLMVEDDLTARNVLEQMVAVKFQGCTIYTADNGVLGLISFKEHAPDIIVTDINMPEMGGVEMAREIRALNADVPFVVLTAYGDDKFYRDFDEVGFCSYIVKPVNFKELFAAIEKCLPPAVSEESSG